jgi:uncharacterized protein (DUF736 family)
MSEQTGKAKDIGALWEKTSKAGRRFLSGTIDGKRIVVFANVHKQPGERTPDWRIYEDTQPAPGAEQASSPAATENRPAPRPAPRQMPVESDDIPF